jgi:glutathione S-transferase
MEGEEIILYGYYRSSSSWRLRTILNLKGIKYTRTPVNLVTAEHSGEDYKELNPVGLVPSLKIGGTIMIESMAIAEYLEEAYPGRRRNTLTSRS